ncbi:MAG: hypothetical protein JW882_14690 [Deltaproteobacteria bacterium]|nr:hypothetical protein [Deltaproteobacteria bacterium]
MSSQKQYILKGVMLIGSFLVVLCLLFFPLFNGHNALEFLDNLYNSISKGSANYLPSVKEEILRSKNREIHVFFTMNGEKESAQTAQLFEAGGCRAHVKDNGLEIKGYLHGFLLNTLYDAEKMYANQGEHLRKKYGYDERRALYNWWRALKAIDFELSKQKLFKEAKVVAVVQNKAVETAYNYYGIEAQSVRDRCGILIISLLFYVVYTLWYGFGVLYLFEGLGLKLGH